MADFKVKRGGPAPPEWFTDPDGAFGEEYFETQEVILTPERTQDEVDFVIAHGDLRRGDAILDIPCGHGRHAVELAKRGFDVTGVDLSPAALGRARAAAERMAVAVRFLSEDMRKVSLEGQFDLALNLYNSIGYADEADDRETFRRIKSSLKPDGRLIVDISSLHHVTRLHEASTEGPWASRFTTSISGIRRPDECWCTRCGRTAGNPGKTRSPTCGRIR